MIVYVLVTSGVLLLLSLELGSWILLLSSLATASLPLMGILVGRMVLSTLRISWLPHDHELHRILEGIAPPRWRVRLGIRPGPPDAFAAQVGVRSGAIVLTHGMLDLLSEEELKAVLAHEMCHLVEHHPMIRIAALALSLMNIPVGTIMGAALSRRLEYRADEFSVFVTGRPHHLASALVKVAATKTGNPFLVAGFTPSLRGILGLFSWSPSLKSRLRRIEHVARKLSTGTISI